MKKVGYLLAALLMPGILLLSPSHAPAATDGSYNLFQVPSSWDGAAPSRTAPPTADYDYAYGDEGSITYTLPWPFSFYGQSYSQITADTNGNIWFAATGAAHSITLSNTGRGPVIAAWNNDLSSRTTGGVFIRHKTNPERVVVEWRAETYTDEAGHRPNRFAATLFQNGSLRLDYGSFTATTLKDYGSGISRGDGSAHISLSGSPYTLSGQSYGIGSTADPAIAIDPAAPPTTSCATLAGAMQVGSTVTIATSSGATVGAISYPTPTSWTAQVCNLPAGDTTVTVTATAPGGQVSDAVTTLSYGTPAVPVPGMGPAGMLAAMAGLALITMQQRMRRKERGASTQLS
jgi:hypothetical protein